MDFNESLKTNNDYNGIIMEDPEDEVYFDEDFQLFRKVVSNDVLFNYTNEGFINPINEQVIIQKVIKLNKWNIPDDVLKHWSYHVESDKTSATNGTNRRRLYEEFIKYAKIINKSNTFETVYDKRIFSEKYPLIPYEMRFFYRLACPKLCILKDNLTFFRLKDIESINKDNKEKDKYVVFAGTMNYFVLFNDYDKGIYKATEKDDKIELLEKIADSFDLYIQKIVDKGDILGGVLDDEHYEYVNTSHFHKFDNEDDRYLSLYKKVNESASSEIIPIIQMDQFLERSYRTGWDYNTGHQIKIVYSFEGINVPDRMNRENMVVTENTNIFSSPQIISIVDMVETSKKHDNEKHGPTLLQEAEIFSPEIMIEKGYERYWDLSIGGKVLEELKRECWDCTQHVKVGQTENLPVYKYVEEWYSNPRLEFVENLNRPSEELITEAANDTEQMMGPEMRDRLEAMLDPYYKEVALSYKKPFDPYYDERNKNEYDCLIQERILNPIEIRNVLDDLSDKYNEEFIIVPPNSKVSKNSKGGAGVISITPHDAKEFELFPNLEPNDSFAKDRNLYIAVDPLKMSLKGFESEDDIEYIISHEYGHLKTIPNFHSRDNLEELTKDDILRRVALEFSKYGIISEDQTKADAQYLYYQLPIEKAANEYSNIDDKKLTRIVTRKLPSRKSLWIDFDKFVNFRFSKPFIDLISGDISSIDEMSINEVYLYYDSLKNAISTFIIDNRIKNYFIKLFNNELQAAIENKQGHSDIIESFDKRPRLTQLTLNSLYHKSKYNFFKMKLTSSNIQLLDTVPVYEWEIPNIHIGLNDIDMSKNADYSFVSKFEY